MAKYADLHNFMSKQTTAKYNNNIYYYFSSRPSVVDIICSFTEMCVYLILLYSLLFKLCRIGLLFFIILHSTCV